MELIKTIHSSLDNTIKYIFKNKKNFVVELSYINKNDGKDIICVPTHTMCNIGCKFCHTTDYIGKIKSVVLTHDEMSDGIRYIITNEGLKDFNRTLLISFMGCGEPILNHDNVIQTMIDIKDLEHNGFPYVRFAIATSVPKNAEEKFFSLVFKIKKYKLPVKMHLSLHYTNDKTRKEWMPKSLDIVSSIDTMSFYKDYTGNNVEIHYTLIDGLNDTEENAKLLSELLKGKDFNVKFLFFNEKESIDYHASNKDKIEMFETYLRNNGIKHEYYIPPGLDIGASCGQFLMENYFL